MRAFRTLVAGAVVMLAVSAHEARAQGGFLFQGVGEGHIGHQPAGNPEPFGDIDQMRRGADMDDPA